MRYVCCGSQVCLLLISSSVVISPYVREDMSRVVRKPAFCKNAKTKTQISFAVTAKLISAFVFATNIVKSLYFLNTKFQASSHLVWLYSPVCVGPGRKPRRQVFSERGSYILGKGSWVPPFRKELFTRLPVCSLCDLSI